MFHVHLVKWLMFLKIMDMEKTDKGKRTKIDDKFIRLIEKILDGVNIHDGSKCANVKHVH
jgi:hypothetical protein